MISPSKKENKLLYVLQIDLMKVFSWCFDCFPLKNHSNLHSHCTHTAANHIFGQTRILKYDNKSFRTMCIYLNYQKVLYVLFETKCFQHYLNYSFSRKYFNHEQSWAKNDWTNLAILLTEFLNFFCILPATVSNHQTWEKTVSWTPTNRNSKLTFFCNNYF